MRVMTYNIFSCRDHMHRERTGEERFDVEAVGRTIRALGADIVGLNEVRAESDHETFADQPGILARVTGLEHHRFGRTILVEGKHPYGNALLSRRAVLDVRAIPVPDPEPRTGDGYYETRGLIKARLEGGITLLVIHMGLNPDEQENAVATVLEQLEGERCILMGDFNMLPDDPILAPIRQRMTDTAQFIPGEGNTFPSHDPDRKIDYIFVSPDIRVLGAQVPAVTTSDHRPIVADLLVPGVEE